MLLVKQCSKCAELLAESQFAKDRQKRDGLRSACKVCLNKQTRERRVPGQQSEYSRRWREQNPGYAKDYYAQHREEIIAYGQKYRENNPTYRADYYERNKERAGQQSAAWLAANPERSKEIARGYRARRNVALGSHTEEQWQELCRLYGLRCLCCGKTDSLLTQDHIVPLSKGGSDNIDNIQPLCKPCNSRKSTKTIDFRGGTYGKLFPGKSKRF